MSQDLFTLSESFIKSYASRRAPFGFGALGELTYLRTYSRLKEDGSNEQWHETVRRVVEGTFQMQQRHIVSQHLGWSDKRATKTAQEMYDRMWNMKFLPPGRGLWAMGSSITNERGLYAALNNCAFVSTANLAKDIAKPFTFLMDMSMLGVGVGFDTLGAGSLKIRNLGRSKMGAYQIPDTREGWVESVRRLLESMFCGDYVTEFDYSLIRPAGEPIRGFGGMSSGPGPLKELHDQLLDYLGAKASMRISDEDIVTIQNLIGKCVVAGNVRRSAEISFGDPTSESYLGLKDYRWDAEKGAYVGPSAHRAGYGWTSNNSIFAELGMDYSRVAAMTAGNGEPGYQWMHNARAYGRMVDAPNWKDKRAAGANPCVEQSLESYEMCCLVENFLNRHDDIDDFERTLKFSYLYAKTVTLGKTHWAETNKVMLRNRRIGCSVSGVQQFVQRNDMDTLRTFLDEGYKTVQEYDRVYSEWLCVPKSIKTTSVKPSGTVSLLGGATPGLHWPESAYYIRRIRLSTMSYLVQPCIDAGYSVEPDVADHSSVVVSIPVCVEPGMRSVADVSMWEQLNMAAFLQRHWSDNQVSCTVTFDPEREGPQIKYALDHFQYQLKGVSFLPRVGKGAYAQMPYEAITEDQYAAMSAGLAPINFGHVENEKADVERFCDGDTCIVP